MSGIELTVTPFDHSNGDPAMTAMRGMKLDASTGFTSGRVFSTHFPTVFVSDEGSVEMSGELLVTGDRAAAWFRAVADYIDGAS